MKGKDRRREFEPGGWQDGEELLEGAEGLGLLAELDDAVANVGDLLGEGGVVEGEVPLPGSAALKGNQKT